VIWKNKKQKLWRKTKAMGKKKVKDKQGGRDKNPSLLPWKATENGGETSQMEVAKPYSLKEENSLSLFLQACLNSSWNMYSLPRVMSKQLPPCLNIKWNMYSLEFLMCRYTLFMFGHLSM
jgi:hypothetical protein